MGVLGVTPVRCFHDLGLGPGLSHRVKDEESGADLDERCLLFQDVPHALLQ